MRIALGFLIAFFSSCVNSQQTFTIDSSICDMGKNKPSSRVEYPSASYRGFESGTVVLNVRTNQNGCPTSIALEESSGFIRLDAAVIEVVKTFKFKKNNEQFPFKYTFSIEGSPHDCVVEKRNEVMRVERLDFNESHAKAIQICTTR
jgi:TonB family protein